MLRLCWASQLHWLQALHRQQMRRQLDVIREAIHANNCSIASSRAYRERIDSDSHLLACQPTEVVNRHVPAYLTEITPGNSADIKNTEQDLSRTWNLTDLTDLTDQKKDVSECFLLVSPDAPSPGGHMGTWAHGGHMVGTLLCGLEVMGLSCLENLDLLKTLWAVLADPQEKSQPTAKWWIDMSAFGIHFIFTLLNHIWFWFYQVDSCWLWLSERQLLDVSTRSRKRISMSHAVYMECVGGLVDCTNNLENFPSCIDIEIHWDHLSNSGMCGRSKECLGWLRHSRRGRNLWLQRSNHFW